MSNSNQTKIISFSQALYNKHSMNEVNMYAKGAIKEQHKMILGDKYYQVLKDFNNADLKNQRLLLETDIETIVRAHAKVIIKLDSNKEALTYTILSLDGILFETPDAIKQIYKLREEDPSLDLVDKLQKLLSKDKKFYNTITLDAASNILAILVSDHDHYEQFDNDVIIHINHIIGSSLKSIKALSDYTICVCLSHLLLVPGKAKYFVEASGIDLLKTILEKNLSDLNVVYYVLLNIWILSFDRKFISRFADPKMRIISNIISALKNISREKLSRIAFRIFRNLCESSQCIELMVDNNLRKVVDNELRKNIKDSNLRENLDFLVDILEKNYRILSSFEKFAKEIETLKFSWGPCHSENFWKEHVKSFEKNDFFYIHKLVELLKSKDITTRAIACYDLGEFCRFHHFARKVLEDNGGKEQLMAMIQEEESAVREQALLAVQKMMIHNWQSLRA